VTKQIPTITLITPNTILKGITRTERYNDPYSSQEELEVV
jgi:hypothetical protein